MAPCLATQQSKDLSSKSTTSRDAYGSVSGNDRYERKTPLSLFLLGWN
jgi:hypothetical protein